MKKIIVFSIICLNVSCLFPLKTKVFSTFKVDENSIVELVYMDAGSTTENIVEVRKKEHGHIIILERIIGLDDTRKVDYKKVNDTILKITFTDTVYFIGSSFDFIDFYKPMEDIA